MYVNAIYDCKKIDDRINCNYRRHNVSLFLSFYELHYYISVENVINISAKEPIEILDFIKIYVKYLFNNDYLVIV